MRQIFGLDIRQNAVSAVLLKSGLQGSRIESHLHIPLADGIDAGLVPALTDIRSQMDINGAACIASYPASWLSYRNLRVPFKDRKKIRQILPFELEATLPYPVDNVLIDFHVISSTPEYSDILAVIAEKKRLKSFLDMLNAAQMKPQVVTIGGYCTALSLNKSENAPQNRIIIDIDAENITMFVCAAGQIQLIRAFSLSGPESAASLGLQLERTLSSIEDILPEYQPEALFVSGQEISPEIRSELENRFELSPKRADVLDNDLLKNHPVQNWESQLTDHALALALAETEGFNDVNLRQGVFASTTFWAEYKTDLIQSAALVAVILVLAFSSLVADIYAADKKAAVLTNQINGIFSEAFPGIKKITDPVQQMKTAIQEKKKEALLSGETVKNLRMIDILNDISRNVPKETDVDLTQMVIAQDGISIGGETSAFNVVDDMKNRLEKAALFKKVTIVSAKTDKTGNRVLFKLNIEL
ncbi:MAG TPA: hypothetical protein DCQ37_07255 [Desulfobacteraceae bacterium]|nr:hypothetical protein [Desulfobacteraceae bacterium]